MTEAHAVKTSDTLDTPAQGRPVILCVDDEPNVLEGIRDTLRRSFEVRTAQSGPEGLEMLRAAPETFAIVISDMQMPTMAGDVFLSQARIAAPNAVRILLTGHADMDAAVRAVNHAHLFRFLTKPCAAEELLRACAAAFGQHRLMSAERVLLEQTLRGSVDALVGILALVSPAAFGRGGRVKALVAGLADAATLADRWEIEVAAMLADVGAVTLPQATAEKLYAGDALNRDEQTMVDQVPTLTRQLLSNIPRLDGVVAILKTYLKEVEPGDLAAINTIPEGARVLRIASDYDELESRGATPELSLGTMNSRGIYDRAFLELFARVIGVGNDAPVVREITTAELETGMTLAEDVTSTRGELLIARGQAVSAHLIERLRNIGSDTIHQPLRVFEG